MTQTFYDIYSIVLLVIAGFLIGVGIYYKIQESIPAKPEIVYPTTQKKKVYVRGYYR